METGRDIFLLDLRAPEEFHDWRIEGSRPLPALNVHYSAFLEDEEAVVDRLPRDRQITVLCAKGGASEYVAAALAERGFAVRHLVGGMQAWSELYAVRRVPTEGLVLLQFDRVGKGCLSYLIASRGEAVVVDPGRHVDRYLKAAEDLGVSIRRVVDTHVHADHISGGRALAEATGAPYHLYGGSGTPVAFPFEPLRDGDRLTVGGVSVEVVALHTPGHTPESVCLLVDGRHLLSGDTVFVESLGRPDLGGKAEEWVRDLYRTLFQRLSALPDDVVIYPAHYASPREADADGVYRTTFGDVRRRSPLLRLTDPAAFEAQVLAGLQEQPPNFERIRQINMGALSVGDEEALELEIGPNRCAVAHLGNP
ncbi:MAG: MBL fold metallo-hydrolase [Clostridia bacterium]|nr:MBL fold metallo-hydrolase [Clostridia bacterium]